jgi:hypothetical protein
MPGNGKAERFIQTLLRVSTGTEVSADMGFQNS